MKIIQHKRFVAALTAMLFTFAFHFNSTAQTCNSMPGAAGFHTAGGFGGCVMQFDITYDCGSGPVTVTCYLDAGGDGFDLPAGCCLTNIAVYTPYQGVYNVNPNMTFGMINPPPSGLPYPVGPTPCDQHDVNGIHWHFDMGPCRPGSIHVN